MSQYIEILTLTARSATLPVTAGRAVGYDGAQATAAGQACQGIANSTVAANVDYPVIVLGTALATSGAAFAIGAELAADATGKLVTATAGQRVVCFAREAATAADQTIRVLVK